MPQSVLERTGEQISETVGKAARATSNIGDAMHERLQDARAFARRGAHRAEEMIDRGEKHVRRHPTAAVTGIFVLGLGIGVLVGWTLRRK
jgi:ElaB/YqjD/DUF883 family membrane-anchored ribosome-binding protein